MNEPAFEVPFRDKTPTSTFCQIVDGTPNVYIVFQDELSCAVFVRRPVFLGHCFVVPRAHISSSGFFRYRLFDHYFTNVQLLSDAVERNIAADGTFVAMNNEVSQSVAHVHVHIVPQRYKDRL